MSFRKFWKGKVPDLQKRNLETMMKGGYRARVIDKGKLEVTESLQEGGIKTCLCLRRVCPGK